MSFMSTQIISTQMVDSFDVLAHHGNPRPGNSDTAEDRNVEFNTLGVDRVEALVVNGNLWNTTGREGSDGFDVEFFV